MARQLLGVILSFSESIVGGLLMDILIVEDDDDHRDVMERLIKNDRYRDVLTVSGEKGLSLLMNGTGIELDLIFSRYQTCLTAFSVSICVNLRDISSCRRNHTGG
jgi:response regulator RpfG family c-di-GMP phosphodiesterase